MRYSFAGNDLGGFSIETASGELRVADEAVMDFETTPSFSLTVEVSDGDLSSSATVTVDLNDVDENTLSVGTPQDDFLVYPNPVADKLSVELKAPLEHLSIYDVSGVLTKKYLRALDEYDVSDLSEGVYTIIIETEDARYVRRFIKK